MVVFKKPSKVVQASSSQTTQPLDRTKSKSNTPAALQPNSPTTKAPPTLVRYSDVAAGRDARAHGTPIEKLMYIPELCDEVLGYLPMDELLLATRVCHAFKTNIENSSTLQAKLFLAPDLTIKKKAISATGTLLSGTKAEQHIAAIESAEDDISGEIALYQAHPCLQAGRLSDRYRHMGVVKYSIVHAEASSVDFASHLSFRDRQAISALPETSILHKMLLCQPPATEVSIWLPKLGSTTKKTIHREAGVTIGDVVCTARETPRMRIFGLRGIEVVLKGGFAVESRAKNLVEKSGELSADNDPTRWLLKDGGYVLQDGGFAFA